MSFQKLIQSTFLNKNKKENKIKLNNGNIVSVKSGDILYVQVYEKEGRGLFKARFVDVEDGGDIWAYLLNSDDDFIDIKINQDRIEKIESPS